MTVLDVPLYEPDLADALMNTRFPRRVLTVLWGIRPDRGEGWLGVSGQVQPDAEKAQTFTTWDRAETHIRLYLIGGLKAWKVSQIPYRPTDARPLNPDLTDPNWKPAA